ncbi:MAG: MurR/RpiR family transcriptional regulator [Clostridia bacterium]
MKARYSTFTRAQRDIADYIFAHSRETLVMSISQLASECGVGDTSIFRFCQDIGLSGFQDFRLALAFTLSTNSVDAFGEDCVIRKGDSTQAMINKACNNNLSALRETRALLSAAQLDAAVKHLLQANRIGLFGMGMSLASVIEAYQRFLCATPKVTFAMDTRTQRLLASMLSPGDVALLFSYSGNEPEMVELAEKAHQCGAYIIIVTRFINSPLYQRADLCFLCGSNSGPYQAGELSVKCAHIYLLEMLCAAYCMQSGDVWRKNQAQSVVGEDAALAPNGMPRMKRHGQPEGWEEK